MKFLETHFEDYIQSSQKNNLNVKLEKIFKNFPNKIFDLKNLIFYGPSGVGKYTQMLRSIKKYSPSELKYEKKISIMFNKQPFFFKISDIHYEIDMSILGCNSKLLWHEIYQQIVDIISAKNEKSGIIVCKYFHDIHSELLENIYSYMQHNNSLIDIKYILITEEISFIPDNILNCCEIITIPRPSKIAYSKITKQILPKDLKVENIVNIKNIHTLININELMHPYKIICDKIIEEIINNDIKFLKFRDLVYDIFIYNLDITDCIWYILLELINKDKIHNNLSKLLIKTYQFLQYYNNNYRPIYHLENYLFYLVTIIHEYK
jgi:hypothetical protein